LYAGIGREAPQHAVPLEECEQAQRPSYRAADEDGPVDQVSHPLGADGGGGASAAGHLARQQGLDRHGDRFAYLGGREPELEREIVGRGDDGPEQRLFSAFSFPPPEENVTGS